MELSSRCDDVEIILVESCVLLTNPYVANSIILLFFLIEDVNHIFNYMYELIYFLICK